METPGVRSAKLLNGFDCTVLSYDKYLESFTTNWARKVEMNEIFEHADILSLHIPLTEESTYLVEQKYISRFKKPIYLINTSRGKCVHTKTMLSALNDGRLSGACLDVLEFEKTSFNETFFSEEFNELIKSEKVILSPHIAGWTHESYQKLSKVLLAKILAVTNN